MNEVVAAQKAIIARAVPSDRMLTHTIRAVVTVVAFPTCTIQTPDGTVIAGVSIVPGYFPLVNDVVRIEVNGPSWIVLGSAINDAWHLINGAGEPAFASSWANVAGTHQVMRFTKIDGVVIVQGAILNGIANLITTLPAGYRPPATLRFAQTASRATTGATWAEMEVRADGTLQSSQIPGTGANNFFTTNAVYPVI